LLAATVAFGVVTTNTRTFPANQESKVTGVIVAKNGNVIKLRAQDDTIGTIDLTDSTKIELKHGIFSRKTAMNPDSLIPGLEIEAQGKGNDQGDLVASRVIFNPNSMRATRQIDTRVSPLEARTGTLENRTGQLEGRAGQIEGRQGQLENQERQTEQHVGEVQTQVGQVKNEADQANQGVVEANGRIANLDNYQPMDKETVYFKINSAVLSPDDKQKLDGIAQKAQNQKGYVIEVAGFADKTGSAALNQELSDRRADAVVRYLEQQGNIPIHRILTPAGMGTSHEVPGARKLSRRVEVTILVNQGLNGGQNGNNGTQQPSAEKAPSTPQQ
jgi:outer membrane protein OmpA-like peptidoglycan-associated protein